MGFSDVRVGAAPIPSHPIPKLDRYGILQCGRSQGTGGFMMCLTGLAGFGELLVKLIISEVDKWEL